MIPIERGRPVRVMVVDDHAEFRESLVALLTTEGLDVAGEASTGPEALETADRVNPDVVLMDVRMPGMDGIETTRRLRARHPDVGVVALTIQEDQQVVRDMLVAGAHGYVLKDSDGRDIVNAAIQAASGGGVLSPAVTPSVIDDLTETLERERRRARELEQANAALVERVGRRRELISRLGHELRTPVTVIMGVARTLADAATDPADRALLLESLVNRAQALARMVERFEAAVDTEAAERVDLVALAEEVAAETSAVRVEAPAGVPKASVNPVLARRIVEELVDNALRFSNSDSPVTIRVGAGHGCPEVRVQDNGPGIGHEDRERIFEPLEQAEDLDVRRHQGTGMGLSLARAAARAMDGDLLLETSGPDGSTFLWMVGGAETGSPNPTG
jgi:signal transduction histidine kinase